MVELATTPDEVLQAELGRVFTTFGIGEPSQDPFEVVFAYKKHLEEQGLTITDDVVTDPFAAAHLMATHGVPEEQIQRVTGLWQASSYWERPFGI